MLVASSYFVVSLFYSASIWNISISYDCLLSLDCLFWASHDMCWLKIYTGHYLWVMNKCRILAPWWHITTCDVFETFDNCLNRIMKNCHEKGGKYSSIPTFIQNGKRNINFKKSNWNKPIKKQTNRQILNMDIKAQEYEIILCSYKKSQKGLKMQGFIARISWKH